MSKGYSLKNVNELSGGDDEFIAVLVQTFLEEIPPDLENMVQAVDADNPQMAYQYAHKMKPNLQLFDIDLLSQIKQIEAWSKTNKPKEEIKAVLDEIVSAVNVAIASLKVDFA
ncbi:Hpt domain-containing protein [Aquimarina spongiae]|uniref:HPt (Histidine-containing phosphotransfer) domain-containing protein n=1 Tax=Aquimarina spongiae TaxID=570521 RepID=A0A1M6K6P7_9FLAO|nr:Hpt domain-containing protein [Aquimarina spongiae]SHJ54513.1 HPt (histidine-containing phosphotransfer) domain-containing protein [Aquimarina spongiae]